MPAYWTTAPEAYDGFGTETLEVEPYQNSKGEQFRVVGIQPAHQEWQIMRYGSGMHVALDVDEFTRQVQLGLIKPTNG